MIKAVINASPMIGLSKINKFDLLLNIFDKIYVPQEVYKEIFSKKSISQYAKKELDAAISQKKIQIYQVKDNILVDKLTGKLHKGEIEVIIAAKETNADFALIDEIAARRLADNFSINTIGVIGILRIAKKKGYILELRSYLENLIAQKFRISDKILNQILNEENEL